MYKKMKSEGIDVIGFGAGEPDFNTPDNIKQAAIEAIYNNFTRYTPSDGTESLRAAVCNRIDEDCGVKYTLQVVISNGQSNPSILRLWSSATRRRDHPSGAVLGQLL